jgi:hypothetical protein
VGGSNTIKIEEPGFGTNIDKFHRHRSFKINLDIKNLSFFGASVRRHGYKDVRDILIKIKPQSRDILVLALSANGYRIQNLDHFIQDYIILINQLTEEFEWKCKQIHLITPIVYGLHHFWKQQEKLVRRLKTFCRFKQISYSDLFDHIPKHKRNPKFLYGKKDRMNRNYVHLGLNARQIVNHMIGRAIKSRHSDLISEEQGSKDTESNNGKVVKNQYCWSLDTLPSDLLVELPPTQ